MRHILILTILLVTNSILFAQKLPKFLEERIEFCDANFSDDQAIQLRTELNELEDYLVKKGLLADKSANSYRAVYEQIAKENDLNFEIDTSFELLDTLEFQVYTGCFYKVLTPDQLSQITARHQRAAEKISENHEGSITPGVVAKRIIDNLTIDDFNLEFYKVSSLLTFYRIAYPTPKLELDLPRIDKRTDWNIETIEIVLDTHGTIKIDDNIVSLEDAKLKVYQYLSIEPYKKGVELTASRETSYESYMEAVEMLYSVYSELSEKFKDIPKNIILNSPK